jgi:hypothetical protein
VSLALAALLVGPGKNTHVGCTAPLPRRPRIIIARSARRDQSRPFWPFAPETDPELALVGGCDHNTSVAAGSSRVAVDVVPLHAPCFTSALRQRSLARRL